ncbi:MAG: rhodanese-like domain-containing protein [Candidatus Cryptobacteroides sp.]
MKRILIVSFIGCIMSLIGCNAQGGQHKDGQGKGFKTVGVEEFAAAVADSAVAVLDVRTADEYAAGHIGRAINIDVLEEGFLAKVLDTVPEGRTVALYCRSGNRSKKAASMLSGKYEVIELGSGYNGWIAGKKKED